MNDRARLIDLTRGGDVQAAHALERFARRHADDAALALALAAGGPGADEAETAARWAALCAVVDAGHGDLDELAGALDVRWPGAARSLPAAALETMLQGQATSRSAALARAITLRRGAPGDALARLLAGERGERLRAVTVAGVPGVCDALAAATHVTHLELLDLSNDTYDAGIGTFGCRVLARAPHLGSVTRLALARNRCGNALAELVAGSSFFARLRALDLGGTTITAAGIKALGAASHLAGLEHLSLRMLSRLGAGGCKAIAGSRALDALRSLDLYACELDDKAIAALVATRTLALERLSLERNRVGPEGLRTLLQSRLGATLRTLELGSMALGDAGCVVLRDAAGPVALRELQLRGWELGVDGAGALADAAALRALERLDLAGNRLGADGVARVLAAPWADTLRELDLSIWAATTQGTGAPLGRIVAEAPGLGALESLVLTRQALGDDGVAALSRAPGLGALRRLGLEGNALGPDGLRALLEAPWLSHLERLELRDNPRLGERAWEMLLEGAERLSRLRVLDLGWAPVGDAALAALRERLPGLVVLS